MKKILLLTLLTIVTQAAPSNMEAFIGKANKAVGVEVEGVYLGSNLGFDNKGALIVSGNGARQLYNEMTDVRPTISPLGFHIKKIATGVACVKIQSYYYCGISLGNVRKAILAD